MDALKSVASMSVAELEHTGLLTPELADIMTSSTAANRTTIRARMTIMSGTRADYPVIYNWLSTPGSVSETTN